MALKVTITRDRYGSLFANTADGAGQPQYQLFQFEYRKKAGRWLFWLRGGYDPDRFNGRAFPAWFFRDACRAKAFTQRYTETLQDEVLVVNGENLIQEAVK